MLKKGVWVHDPLKACNRAESACRDDPEARGYIGCIDPPPGYMRVIAGASVGFVVLLVGARCVWGAWREHAGDEAMAQRDDGEHRLCIGGGSRRAQCANAAGAASGERGEMMARVRPATNAGKGGR